MKLKNIIFCISALVSASSCRTEILETPSTSGSPAGDKSVVLKVTDEVKTSYTDEVKTSYQEGLGVNVDGTENIAVLYAVADTLRGSLKAVPRGASVYTFTIPAGVEPDPMFFGVMPYSQAVSAQATEKRLFNVRIFPVQYPTADSFDPHYDFLSAEGFTVDGGEAEISKFKRLVSPLRVKVKGLPSGTRLRTAELILGQGTGEETCTGLVGDAQVCATDNYRKSAVLSLKNPGNSVSALYPDALEAVGGEWNIWYVVNPSSLYAGSTLTLRLSADSTTFTRKVTVPSNAEIRRNELSQLCVNMSSKDVSTERSVTFDFSKAAVYEALQSSTSLALEGSDGKTCTLSFSRTKCSLEGEDGFPCAIQLTSPEGTGKYLTIPSVRGMNVVEVRLFAQINSACTLQTEDSLAVVKNGAVIASANANMGRTRGSSDYLGNRGGVASLEVSGTGVSSLSGGQIQGRGTALDFSAMTLVLEKKETPVYDSNDYLSMYEAGLDIVIGGKAFNIESCPDYSSYKMSEISGFAPLTGAFSANGLVFIDNDAPDKVITNAGNVAFGKDAVIIGRYISGKGQPRIAVTKTTSYFQVQNSVHLLNLQVEHNSNYCFFTSKSGYSSIYAGDCTFLSTDQYGHGFIRYNASGVGFADVVVDNSIFIYGGGSSNNLYLINNATGGNTAANFAQLRRFEITNSVFIPRTLTASAVRTSVFNAPQKTDGASFVLERNSFYGMTAVTPGSVLSLKSAKSVSIRDNVFYAEPALTSDLTLSLFSGESLASEVTGNWMNRYEAGGFTMLWNPAEDNHNSSPGPFFDTAGLQDFYMPVLGTSVTTSAGAGYETKKWKQWIK